jgi:hypothetical protein
MSGYEYDHDIKERARDFIEAHEDEIRELVKEGKDLTNDNEMDDALRGEEFYFDLEDAVVVVQHSDNVEEDYGLWEGEKDPGQALVIQAQFTAQHDLQISVEEIYEEIKQDYEGKMSGHSEEKADDEDTQDNEFATVFQHWRDSFKIEPLKKGSPEEKNAILDWLGWRIRETGWRNGYPLGSSYIDSRCGAGYTSSDGGCCPAKYIEEDHMTAKLLPHLSGKYSDEIKKYYEKKFGKLPKEIKEWD